MKLRTSNEFALLIIALYNQPFAMGVRALSIPSIEENDQTRARREHLEALRTLVGNVYPSKFERSEVVQPGREDTITAVGEKFRSFEPKVGEDGRPVEEEIELANRQLNKVGVRIAGRISSPPRVMGKAAFVHLSDGKSRLQIYVRKADVTGVRNDPSGEEVDGWELFGLLDHGDFIGVEGYLFVTKTGELSVHVQKLQFLAKALLPMPDKMHGIHDPEIRQRQRYADLIAGGLKLEREEGELTPREVFERRSEAIHEMRRFLEDHGYIEVETPILSPLATGALARPFKTHHNALDIDLYARIAPELYLKRLLVGGFERVYELNRNFRNEGIDRMHNPEFTMLEFYCAYMDVNGMMDLCEEMIRTVVFKVLGDTHLRYGDQNIDFSRRFERLTMREAIVNFWPSTIFAEILDEADSEFRDLKWLSEPPLIEVVSEFLTAIDYKGNLNVKPLEFEKTRKDLDHVRLDYVRKAWKIGRAAQRSVSEPGFHDAETALYIANIFEEIAEPQLKQPTFIYDFPKSISPLSKASPSDPSIAERFELFIAGLECANGFSELNDPAEQYQRFQEQVQQRERGDEEAMVMDQDYIRALSYGMPPAAGIGIGVDRFLMLLTNRQNIREVILFPHMRPERRTEDVLAAPGDVGPES